ncbi:MAG: hypothetical protein E6G42_01770 [Actinobacteria bacterium]|nr:MAG: hypothetical protein E6G42_01770 [Actinomycetota bacterium]
MPTEEPKTAPTAGVSAPEQVDVATLFARLKEEVRHAPGLDVSDGFNRGLVRTRLRSVAERWWPVSAERPLERRPGVRGAVLYPVKKVLRRLMRFYVEPFAADQRAFNDAALKLVDELFEEVDLAFGRLDHAERELAERRKDARRVGELEERLTRVERRRDGATAAPATVAAQPAAAALPDYFAFESRMRGRSEEIRERQRAGWTPTRTWSLSPAERVFRWSRPTCSHTSRARRTVRWAASSRARSWSICRRPRSSACSSSRRRSSAPAASSSRRRSTRSRRSRFATTSPT